ncbi:phosphoribosylformylglycinamidine cyclo-ligase, partial [Halobacillus trueperi]
DPARIEQIVKGISDGCEQSGAALVGGETAEMPGMYEADEYDLAGFVVGMADKEQIITGSEIKEGDVLVGLPSSGVHSNGFSLVRKLIADLDLDTVPAGWTRTLGDVLLTPTRIYVPEIQALKKNTTIKGIAHITGGGFYENLPRTLPEGLGCEIDIDSWQVPEVFRFLQEKGSISNEEMFGVFNMGIGMVVVLDPSDVNAAFGACDDAVVIGKVTNEEGVQGI